MPTLSKKPAPLGHQPGLDGIRGIAILAVVIFHLEWPWLPGGFLGVDIFFTLSGFLITSLLLDEQFVWGKISLGRFFARRGIRLYPTLVSLVIVSTAFTLLAHRDVGFGQAGLIALSVLGYASNWAKIMATSDWFGGMPHTWSLAIEAHFYLLWAFTVALVARRLSLPSERARLLRILAVVALGVALSSAGWRAFLDAQGAPWWRTYLGTDTRFDAVFIGALAGLIRLHLLSSTGVHWFVSARRASITMIEVSCVAVLAILLATIKWRTALPGMLAFSFTSGATALLILTTTLHSNSLFSGVVRTPILTWLGRISYSLYIWHVPASKFANIERLHALGVPPVIAEAIRLGVSLMIAVISFYMIERTFVRLRHRFASQALGGSGAAVKSAPPFAR